MSNRSRPLAALLFDLNRTLVKGEFLVRVYEHFGGDRYRKAEREYAKGPRGIEGRTRFAEQIVASMEGCPSAEIKEYVTNDLKGGFIEGVEVTIPRLQKMVQSLGIITKNIGEIAGPIGSALGIPYVYTSTALQMDGKLTGKLVMVNKAECVVDFSNALGCNPQETGYVSDEAELLGETGYSILLSPHPREAEKIDGKKVFSVENFPELLNLAKKL